jgi:hypothetical protein
MLIHLRPSSVGFLALSGLLVVACSQGDGTSPGSSAVTPPVGRQLASGALTLRGVTSDGWAVYSEDDSLTLRAAPIGGGAPRDIVALSDSFAISVWFDEVFVWPSKNDAGVGPLTVWTSQSGAHAVSQASLAPWVAASADGHTILYVDQADASGQTGNVVGAASDGSGATVLVSAVGSLQSSACSALMGFAGTYALVAHCDGGASKATISSFALPSWQRADLATGAVDYWSTDPKGTMLLTGTAAGSVVVPMGGGTQTVIDPAGTGGTLISDGQSVIYGTSSDALRRSPVTEPKPTTLVVGGFAGMWALSPDEKWLLYYQNLDTQHFVSDLFLASTSTAGAATALSTAQNARIWGDAFTSDASHALYFTDIDPTSNVGTLHAMDLGGSKTQVVVGQNTAIGMAGLGGKVIYNDNYTWNGTRGHADVRVVDLSGGAAPVLIVNQADSEISMSPGLDSVIYTWSLDDGPRAGLWVAPVP